MFVLGYRINMVWEKNIRVKRWIGALCDDETKYLPKNQVVFAAKPGLGQKPVSQATLYPARTTTSCSQMPHQAVWEGPRFHKFSGTGSFYVGLYYSFSLSSLLEQSKWDPVLFWKTSGVNSAARSARAILLMWLCLTWHNVNIADRLELLWRSLLWWPKGKHASAVMMQLIPPVGAAAV